MIKLMKTYEKSIKGILSKSWLLTTWFMVINGRKHGPSEGMQMCQNIFRTLRRMIYICVKSVNVRSCSIIQAFMRRVGSAILDGFQRWFSIYSSNCGNYVIKSIRVEVQLEQVEANVATTRDCLQIILD